MLNVVSYKQFKGEQHKGQKTNPLLYKPIFNFYPIDVYPIIIRRKL